MSEEEIVVEDTIEGLTAQHSETVSQRHILQNQLKQRTAAGASQEELDGIQAEIQSKIDTENDLHERREVLKAAV